jgi:pimeloyl-ACP methyl ester carboxylesterase
MDNFIDIGQLRLHYLSHEGQNPPLLLMHGLTANAHAFDGLVKAGLCPQNRLISVDLRGRGLSDKPDTGYSIATHAQDIVSLLDALEIQKITLGGHSFGAFLGLYIAKHYPERVDKLLMLDAAARLHPDTREMLIPSMSRLGQIYPSFEAYLGKVKNAPYLSFWDNTMLSYYEADVKTNEDGSVIPRSLPENIKEAADAVLGEPWLEYLQGVSHSAILINATGNYSDIAPLLPKEFALETVNMMQNCQYVEVVGNHQTMLYGEGAKQIVAALQSFIAE